MTITDITLRHPAGHAIAWKMDLDPGFVSDQHILEYVAKQACYEPDVAWVLMRALRPGDNAVDVGACVGFFTLLMSRLVGPEGRVISIEPGVDNLERLRQNLLLNPGTVEIIDQPLSHKAEQVKFWYNQDSSGGHALWDPGKWHQNVESQKVQFYSAREATTLNRICPNPCRLIKIDTEGAEDAVLRGASTVLFDRHPPFVVAEINEFGLAQMQSSPDILRAYMRLMGYDTFMLHSDGAKPEPVSPRKGIVCDRIWNVLFSTPQDVESIWQ